MKKYYCPYCRRLRYRQEIKIRLDKEFWFHLECKKCGHNAIYAEDAIEEILHTHSSYNKLVER